MIIYAGSYYNAQLCRHKPRTLLDEMVFISVDKSVRYRGQIRRQTVYTHIYGCRNADEQLEAVLSLKRNRGSTHCVLE